MDQVLPPPYGTHSESCKKSQEKNVLLLFRSQHVLQQKEFRSLRHNLSSIYKDGRYAKYKHTNTLFNIEQKHKVP